MIDFFLCSNKYRIEATNTINLSLRVYYIPSFSIAPSLRGVWWDDSLFMPLLSIALHTLDDFLPFQLYGIYAPFLGFICVYVRPIEKVLRACIWIFFMSYPLFSFVYYLFFWTTYRAFDSNQQWNVYSESRLPIHFIHFSFSAHFNNKMYQNAVSKHRILLVAQDAINFCIQNRNHSKYSIFTSFIERMR